MSLPNLIALLQSGTGNHTINVEIRALPANIGYLVFTVSAWTTTLSGILQPSVQLIDQENGVEMCRYTHEDKEGANTHTAVIMCMLHRANPSEKWNLSSIGQMCNGRAGNYSELRSAIRLHCLGITPPPPVAAKKKALVAIMDDDDDG